MRYLKKMHFLTKKLTVYTEISWRFCHNDFLWQTSACDMKFLPSSLHTSAAHLPFKHWLWRSYARTAVIPLLCIELAFLVVYWVGNQVMYQRNLSAMTEVSAQYFEDLAERDANIIGERLEGVEHQIEVFALATQRALSTPSNASEEEKSRYAMSPEGVFYTRYDNGNAAVFYSGIVPIGEKEKEKVWRTTRLDPLMKDLVASHPLITQVYFNTFDSYNRIYPYFDVLSQYPPKMDIPSYNFYYEADGKHNPSRKTVWTDAYVDPAGNGWMVSAISPIWIQNKLEAVAGADVTIDTVLQSVLSLDIPWKGYALLLGRDNTILALPAAAEKDFGLKELREHHYAEAIKKNIFKPETFRLDLRQETKEIAKALGASTSGITRLRLNGDTKVATWATVPGPGWKLLVVASEANTLAHVNEQKEQFLVIGLAMLAVLIVFYVGFFIVLNVRARAMSRKVAEPLETLGAVITKIGAGDYHHNAPTSGVEELHILGEQITQMGHRLGDAMQHLSDAGKVTQEALQREREFTDLKRHFIQAMSHEVRTPLALVDGVAQSLERRGDRLDGRALADRAKTLRGAVERLQSVINSTLDIVRLDNDGQNEMQYTRPISSLLVDALQETQRPLCLDFSAEWRATVNTASFKRVLVNLLTHLDKNLPSTLPLTATIRDESGRTLLVLGGPSAWLLNLPEWTEEEMSIAAGADLGLILAEQILRSQGGRLFALQAADASVCLMIEMPNKFALL